MLKNITKPSSRDTILNMMATDTSIKSIAIIEKTKPLNETTEEHRQDNQWHLTGPG